MKGPSNLYRCDFKLKAYFKYLYSGFKRQFSAECIQDPLLKSMAIIVSNYVPSYFKLFQLALLLAGSSSISPDNSASAKSNPVVELSHFTLTSLDETSVTDLDESKIFSTSPVCTLTSSLDSSMSQLSSTTRSPANKPTTLVGPRKPPVKLPPLTVKTSLVTAKPSGGPIVIQPDLPNIPPYLVMLKTLQEPLKPLPPKPIFLQEKSSMGGSLSQNMYPSSDSEQDD